MLDKDQIYIVVDIETNGLIAGKHSILSIGAVATTSDEEIDEFYKKLHPLEELTSADQTMKWWKTQPEAWREVNTDLEPAEEVVESFKTWIKSFEKKPIFVASPLVLDYPFIRWYLYRFGDEQLFEDAGPEQRTLDLASFTSGKLTTPLTRSRRMQLPDQIIKGMPEHSHKALEDARGYGVILRNVLNV